MSVRYHFGFKSNQNHFEYLNTQLGHLRLFPLSKLFFFEQALSKLDMSELGSFSISKWISTFYDQNKSSQIQLTDLIVIYIGIWK